LLSVRLKDNLLKKIFDTPALKPEYFLCLYFNNQ